MHSSISDIGFLRKQVQLTFDDADLAEARRRILREAGQQVRLPGFRPKKVAASLVEKRYGEKATRDALQEVSERAFSTLLAEQALRPFGPIDVDIEDSAAPFVCTYRFDILPEVALPDPAGISLPAATPPDLDAEVTAELATLRARLGTTSPLAEGETVATGDHLVLSGTVTVAGEVVRTLHDFHHHIGEFVLLGTPASRMVEIAAGATAGSVLRFTTTLPATFNPTTAAGKEAEVEITIQSVNRQRPAVLDDALAQKFNQPDVPALLKTMRSMRQRAAEQALYETRIGQIRELLSSLPVELPTALVETMRTAIEHELEGKADLPAGEAERRLATAKQQAVLTAAIEAIVAKGGIVVQEQDLIEQLQMAATRSGRTFKEIVDAVRAADRLPAIRGEIKQLKALVWLLDQIPGKPHILVVPEAAAEPAAAEVAAAAPAQPAAGEGGPRTDSGAAGTA
jgi:trigger factor